MRSAYRDSFEPDQAMNNTGFRIVRNGEDSSIHYSGGSTLQTDITTWLQKNNIEF